MERKWSGIAPSRMPAGTRENVSARTRPSRSAAPHDQTFPAIVEARGLEQPDKVVFTWLGDGAPRDTTYGELLAAVRRIAADLSGQVAPGERAVLVYPPGADYIAAFLGCLHAGIIAVPCYPPRNRRGAERIAAILADCSPALAMTSLGAAESLRKLVACGNWLETSIDGCSDAHAAPARTIHPACPDGIAFLQYTSGSTGTPKGVMISHHNLVTDASLIQSAFSLDEHSIGATWLPPYHDMGLIGGLLEVIYLGIHSVVMAPNAFLQKPYGWLKAISDYRVTHSGAPNFAYDLCVSRITDQQKATLDLSSWAAAYCGAEPIRPHTLDRFAAAFAGCGFRRNAFLTCYGLAEATLMVSSSRRGEGPRLGTHDDEPEKTLVSSGEPVTQQMKIVDPHSRTVLNDGQIGEIWVAGPNVAAGYWGNEAATRECFDVRLTDAMSDTAFMRTGDLGFLRDGQLFVSGRIKDLIIINGRNIYPQDVEAASFGSHADLRIDAAAAFTIEHEDGERLVVVQELDFRKSVDDVMCGRIAEAVFERIGVQPSTIVLVKAGTVPRTSSGKIRRRQCRADFINGTLPELARHERNEGGRAAAARLDARLLSRGEGAQDSRASDPSPSAAAIVEWLCARLESRLNLPTRSIDPAQSFFYHGVDSIQAVETCGALAEWLDRPVEPMLFWDYPTPAELARHLAGQTATPRAVDDAEPSAISHHVRSEPVAIIGMGCRFPGADGPEAFWQMLLDGVDAVREVPAARTAAGSFRNTGDSAIAYTRIGGFLDEVDRFDGDLFGIAPIEAVRIDPQQRLVLEVAWEALENAGIAAATLAGSQTGVFVGVSSHDYDEVRTASREPLSLYDATGSSVSVVANRLSYLLDLRGPSLAIDTACSSSLVAVHAACRSLLNGESRLAMAGGVNLILSATSSAPFAKSGLLSPDGRCKAFDDSANGYVRGEGCGMVVLKRLSDALRDGDPVRAVILGSAVQQDGRSNGLAAPNGIAQAEVIRQALAQAHVSPAALDHVEAHGTGTALGDPVELNALKAVLNDGGPCEHPCIVSSVKTNIGHLEAAAGVAGLIKTVLALEHDTMPAHLHFRQLNRHCTLDGTRLEIGGAARAWPRSRRRYAGVSSFGFGGTLAHLVVADAPPVPEAAASDSRMEHSSHAAEASPHLLVWSAKTPTALEQMTDRLAARLRSEDGSLADIAYSLQTGRNALSHRRALVCTDRIEAASLLERRDFARLIDAVTNLRAQPVPVFMFPGQGAQRIGMAHDLYRRFPVFREHFDACSTGFASLIGVDLCELLFARSGVDDARRATELEQTALAQPALFAAEYATARWLMSLGIVPGAMIGHSLGEYVAACLAGVFSFDDALEIVALRGRLMQSQPPGAMATVALGEEALGAWLMDGLSLAAVNGGERCVVSGETSRIDAFVAELNARDVPCRRLHVSHAFHSVMMEPVCEPLREAVARIALHAPAVPFISNVTGDWIDAADAVDPAYWARHLREPVRFAAGLTALAARFGDAALLLEAGPGTTLQTFARQCAYRDGGTPALVLPVLGGEHDAWTFFTALGQLWGAGYAPDWAALHRDAGRRRLTLPTYPFDRQRHWLDPSIESASVFAAAQESTIMSPPFTSPSTSLAAQHAAVAADDGAGATSARRAPRRDRIQAKLRELVAGLLQVEPERVSPHAALLELGADSLVLVQAVRRLEEMFGVAVTIRQLFEELTSIAELAAYMDRHLPATWDNEEPGAQPVAQPAAQPQLVQPAALPAATVPPISTTPAGGTASPPANGLENLIAQQLDVMRLQLSLMRDTAPALPKAMSDTVNESAAATVTRSTSAISHDAGTRPAALRPAQQGFDPYSKLEQPQQAYLHRFIADLLKRTAGSKAHARQYRDVIADYRALAGFRFSAKDTILPLSLGELFYPIVAARSEGAHIIDVDGNDYVDLAMGFGVALFGHSPSFIREAIGAQLAEGMHLGPQSPLAGEIASMVRTLTGMERVAFCNSGTEAMMLAVRLARTRNGRPKIAQFTGSYHGWADGVLVAADPDRDPYALPAAPGLQTGSGEQALVLEYGSAHALQMIRDHAHELSAVLVEPVQSRRPELQPREFLHQLRALTKELDITLIFDEMITGFRLHPGGAQAWFDVRADLVAYGKAAGGGMPIGIVAGDAAHMNGIDGGTVAGAAASVDTTFFAGTFSKHPLALASTHAVLTHLIESGPALQAALTRRTDALVARLNRLFSAHDLPMQMVNCGSLFRLHCLHNLDLFCYHLVANGLYVWEGRTMYLSTAHSDADIDLIYDAFEASARALVHAGFFAGAKPLPPSGGRRPAPGVPVALHAQPKAAAGALAAVTKDQARAVAPRCANTSATAARDGTRTPDFSLSFFGTYDADYQENKYDLLFEAARFADEQRFSAIWLPERHFHAFGGLSPNPSVLAAALARETRHVDLRAGSVVLPLHHPVRVAEEWSVVDNLSDGRVGIAVASGWHPNDFVFAPEVFGRHRDLTFERLGQIQRLWSGAELHLPDGSGQAFAAALFPMPRQKRLPVWVTVVGNPDTYSKAAELGAGILTNLMGQSIDDLASNIALYRRKLAAHGYDARQGKVTVLLHTFVGADREAARRDARQPFLDYLKSSVGLFQNMARALGVQIEGDLKPEDEAYLLSVAYERYTASSALIGDPVSCAEIVRKLAAIGVDEIGCFIDFGVDPHAVMASLPYLQQVRELVAQPPAAPDADEATSAGAAPAPQVWPASTAQRWLWLDHQRGAQNSAHSITAVVELPGAVAVASLDRALEQIVARHEVLRTTFAQQDEDVVQIVGAAHPVRVATKTAQSATDVNVLLAALAADAFDLERGPLFRALRVDMTDGRRLLLWCMHEIVADGASAVLLQEEINALMHADAQGIANPLPPLTMQYRHYAAMQRENLCSASHAARDYWHRQLAAPLPVLDLPFDHPLGVATSAAGARTGRVIGGALYEQVKALTRTRHSTLFMFLQAAVAAWLSRLTGQDDVVIAAPVGARVQPGTEQLIGFFLNTVLLRHRVTATERFTDLLRRVRMTVFDGLEHQDYPFEQLIDELKPPRVRNAFPVTPVMLNVLNYRGAAAAEEQFWSGALNMKAELELYASELDGELRLVCHYRTGLFTASTVDYLIDELVALMGQIVANPDRVIGDFDLFDGNTSPRSGYLRFIEPLEAAHAGQPAIDPLVSRIAAHVRNTPDAGAVESTHGTLSYAALWAQSSAALHAWTERLGVQRGVVVALMCGDRVQHVVSMLAAFRGGLITTPFSAHEPLPRQRAMIDAVEPALWVVDDATLGRLVELHADRSLNVAVWGKVDDRREPPRLPAAWRVVWIDAGSARDDAAQADEAADTRGPAYIFFTSGSTGEPKPIVGRGDSLAQFVDWEIDELALDATVRVSQLASLTFDASLRDIFVPLCAGGTLCIPPLPTRDIEPEALLDWLDAQRISLAHTVPSVFRVWLPLLRSSAQLPALTHLLMSGEPLLPNDVRRWHDVLGERVRLINLYGATETTLVRCFHRVTAADAARDFIPIGRPMPGTRAIVLDANRQICPPGVTGELWLRTAYGTLGYYRQPERTAKVFVSDLFGGAGLDHGEIVYRTGDLATWLDDGTLRLFGRRDMQVKVRGVRVEPEEIENILYAHGEIELAAVVARTLRSGETTLNAYYTAPDELDPAAVKTYLTERLPAELVPSIVERRKTLPLTASGKVDRLALSEGRIVEPVVYEAPLGDLEAAMATLLAQILELPRVGRHDNFFEIGGHSLRALRAISRIRKVFGVDLAPDRFFEAATPAALALEVQTLRDGRRDALRDSLIPPLRRRAPDTTLPLSFEQERVWTQETLGLAGTSYSIPVALTLNGVVDADALERSLSALTQRHEILRTHFESADGNARQIVDAPRPFPLERLDLAALDDTAQRAEIDRLLSGQIDHPFDLATGPLLRATLVRLAETRHVMLLNMHHIVSDGWSADVLVREMSMLYGAFSSGRAVPLEPLPVQYGDYALWQRGWLQGTLLEQQLGYWKTTLAGAPAALALPTDRPRPSEQSFRGARTRFALSATLAARLAELGQRDNATLYMVLLAGFAVLLGRHSGQQDIVIGAPIAGRRVQELESLIGFFVNTLALRTSLAGNPTFAELVARVRKNALSAYAHQDLPFEKLVAELQPVRDLSRQPVFQVMFGFQQATPPLSLPGLQIQQLESGAMAVKFDLSLQMLQGAEGIECVMEYATDLFDRATIDRLIRHYVNLLEAAAADPRQRVGQLPLLDAEERCRLLEVWNDTKAAYPEDRCLHELFEEQASRTPEAVAVVFEGARLSYGELNARANRVARYLRRQGIGPDQRVAICVERSLEMMVSLLGVLKAGAAYVPLDPSYPADRLAYMLVDSAPAAVLTQSAGGGEPGFLQGLDEAVAVLRLDGESRPWEQESGDNVSREEVGVRPQHLAYVIYTSGSTGQPKGVMNGHGPVVNRLHWMQRAYALDASDVVLQKTPLSFDVSVWECFWPLFNGAKLVVARPEGHKDVDYLSDLIVREGVTTLHFVPSMLQLFIDGERTAACESLLRIVSSGEALPVELAHRTAKRFPGAEIYNLYGPTEAAIDVTAWRYDAGFASSTVPLGRPVSNTRLYVLDGMGEPVPSGVAGDLYIGGVQVARGYLKRPGLTAQQFMPDPFSGEAGARMYRTGDLARWLPDGNIEYLGRNDDQVKIRGFRVELGEIEARLSTYEGIREAAVLVREDEAGDRRLVAYYTEGETRDGSGGELDVQGLRAHLTARLPEHMVPAAYVRLPGMPLTPNGKLDRKALPAPDGQAYARQVYEAPREGTEASLARIWEAVLQVDRVGRHDNFFELGGNSLLAIGLLSHMRKEGLAADVRALFNAPTLAALAQAVGGGSVQLIEVPPNAIPPHSDTITPAMLPLVELTEQDIASIVATVPGGAANVQDIYPLAPLQEGILFHHRLGGEGDVYLLPALFGLASRTRLDRFIDALQQVVDRHDILRTAVVWEGTAEPVQVVLRQVALPVEEIEFDPAQGALADQMSARFDPVRYRIDVSQAPLLRCHVTYDKARGRWLLHILVHHLAFDRRTLELLVQEARAIEEGRTQALTVPVPFRNFVAHTRLGVSRREHEAFFREMLADIDAPTAPFGLYEVQGDGSDIEEATHMLSPELASEVRQSVRRLGVSAASLMHLAWALVLARASARSQVVFGTVVFGRMQGGEQAELAMGLLINTLPVRVDIGSEGIEASLKRTHRLLVRLMRHEHAPLSLAQRCSAVDSQMPLFTALLNYRYTQAAHASAEQGSSDPADVIEELAGHERTNYPLTLSVDDSGTNFRLTAQVGGGIEARRICAFMQTALEELLRALRSAPQTGAHRIDVLPAEERRRLLGEWNDTKAAYPEDRCLHELFEEQASRTPEAVAVVFEGARLSYGELNARANRVARYLRRQGIGPDQRVAICVERSLEMMVSLLGVLKAGAAYVPLDPSYPADRLAYMLVDSAPAAVLTQSAGGGEPGFLQGLDEAVAVLRLDGESRPWEQESGDNVSREEVGVRPQHLAYVIYTSGSTGQPKGVMNGHGPVVNRLHWMQRAYALDASDVVLQKTPLSFDVSVWECFWPLFNGAKLVVARPEGHKDVDYLSDLIVREGVTTLHFVPSMLQLFIDGERTAACESLLRIVSSGEALPVELAHRTAKRFPGAEIYNLYGPTEAAIDVTAWRYDAGFASSTVPLGRPVSNTRLYVLDGMGEPVPSGVAGDLYIGGVQVARGYLKRPGLTAQQFMPDPFSGEAGARMYRTGDLARWLPDGNIEYLGRNDDQVKIRGFRVELGEIEARLSTYEGIREAAVLVREDEAGDRRLVAYYTEGETRDGSGGELDVQGLRAHLTARLPEHMVPAAYVRLPGMPLTPNGKLDRKALPAPDGQAYARRVYEAPREGTEASLARIWEAVLQVDRVGRHDNFFELGGNSLLAMSLISRMRQVFGVEVSLRDFFTASTLDGVARTVEASSVDAFSSIDRVSREEPLELSFAQQRLWFLCRMGGASVSRAYHIPAGLTMEGVLDHGALIKALDRIVERHEALRTTFVVVDDKPVQRIGRPDLGFSLQQDDLTARDDAAAELERLAEETFTQPFDLENGPLIRGRLVRLGETRHELLVTMHHIMSDGWSINVLIKELGALYGAYARAQSDPLPVPNVQYADYAAWQRRWVAGDVLQAQSAYWTARLAGVPTLLELPTDRTRPDQQGYTGAQIALTLDESLTARLRALARRSGTTLFMVLLAGWAVVLSKLANQDDVVIGTPVANRTRAELEALIGFFVNTQALRVDLSDRPTVAQLLARVKESVLGAQQHQDLPFEQVVELVNPTRSMAHSPLFQVMFAWQNTEQSPLSLPGLKLQARASDATIAKFDLALSLRESENAIHGSLEYATALFDRETAQRMGEYLRRVLQEMGEKYAQPIGTLSLLSAEERRRLLAEWSETRRAHPEDRCLHELFEEQASRTPEAVAVVFEGARLSYGELNARSNRVARYLRRQGIGPDQRVAICVERSLEMTVSLLGVLKAGAAYVPLDPSYPADRLAYMLADSAPAVLVTQQSLLDSMPGLAQAHDTLLIDACDDESDADLPPLATSAHLAYVIYTSGSTGRPKGVTVTHRNVARLFEATQANFGFSGGDVWTLFHSFAFDFSVWEMWGAWLTGGRLVIVPKAVAQSAEAFYMLLCDAGVTVLNQTPGAFRQLIAAQRTSNAGHRLRHVVFGGEALNTAMLKPWYDDSRNAGTLLVNMYGITETTVHVSYRPLTPEDAMRAGYSPIGRPLDDLGAYLLDDAFEPVPPGVAGELYIAGAGLARGYLNRADLTASRFVPDPFGAPGGRLYRTGDLARRVADGGIEYLGRNDEQVKLRGFRIEPGEIAAKLIQHPSVDDAVVLARDDGHDGKRLVGYYTVRAEDAGTSLSGETLRAHLRAELPDYMVPAAYVKLDAWPLTSNGKLDRRALPAPDDDAYARRVYEAPQGETEMVLARIWSDVLGVERVGRHDNFFELGGHSLLALSLTEQMREANLHVDIRMLFSAPTLAALAEAASDTPEQTVVVPPNLIRSAPLDKAPTDARRRTVELRI